MNLPIVLLFLMLSHGPLSLASYFHELQMGSQWNRQTPHKNQLKENSHLGQLLRSTLSVAAGSGFYLMKYKNFHVIATNKHVAPDHCQASAFDEGESFQIYLSSTNVYFDCDHIIGSWPEHDFALIAAIVGPADESKLIGIGLQLSQSLPQKGEPLAIAGHGRLNNGALSFEASSDCTILSESNEIHLLRDPDTISPSNIRVYSIAHGCDQSHGDSGSPLISLTTGKVVGINWTVGKIPRSRQAYSSPLLNVSEQIIWSDLNYAASTAPLIESLKKTAADYKKSRNQRKNVDAQIILELLK